MKADMPGTIRKRFIVKGRVQKVNYRDEVQDIARALGITGTVANLKTGDVEVICEGEETILERFEKALAMKKGRIDVREVIPAEAPPSKRRSEYFEIKYGPMEEELGERMGAGILYIQEVGDKVDGVGKAVEGVGQKVDSMHSDMNKRFDHMAQRYDLIALSLAKAIDRMDKNSQRTAKAIEQSRKEAAASNRELAKAVNFMIKKLSDRPARKSSRKARK